MQKSCVLRLGEKTRRRREEGEVSPKVALFGGMRGIKARFLACKILNLRAEVVVLRYCLRFPVGTTKQCIRLRM